MLEEEETFWALCYLVEVVLPMDFFTRPCGYEQYPYVLCSALDKEERWRPILNKFEVTIRSAMHPYFISLFAYKSQLSEVDLDLISSV